MISDTHLCSQLQEQFDYYELGLGPLLPETKNQMEKHFESCDHCQKWLSEWELIKLDTRLLDQLEVPSTVLANIMSQIEPAQVAVPLTVTSPTLFKSDLLIALVALGSLLFAWLRYASEGFEGTAAWCFSFIVLFAVHYMFQTLSQGKDQEPAYQT